MGKLTLINGKKTRTVDLTPDYLNLQKRFSRDALDAMHGFLMSTGKVDYSELYRFVFGIRIMFETLNLSDKESRAELFDFHIKFEQIAKEMFTHLERLQQQ